MTFKISFAEGVLRVGFGNPAQNDQIVKDAKARLDEMVASGELSGGKLVRINGPASLPAMAVITHAGLHTFGAGAVFDPKLGKYVVAISHDPDFAIGDLVD